MKMRVMSIFLVLILLGQLFIPKFIHAEGSSSLKKTNAEYIIEQYALQGDNLENYLLNDTGFFYWRFIHEELSEPVWTMAIDTSCRLLEQERDEEFYTRILTSVMTMQQADLSQKIWDQSSFDDLKGVTDYVMDAIDIATGLAGFSGEIASEIADLISVASNGAELVLDSKEKAQYCNLTIQNYAASASFLKAVTEHTDNKMLKNVAEELQNANKQIFVEQIKCMNEVVMDIEALTWDSVLKKYTFSLLKNTDLYRSSNIVQCCVDVGSDLLEFVDGVQDFFGGLVIALGDFAFGTSNTFIRYQEMRTLSEIADALKKANQELVLEEDDDFDSKLETVQKKCELYSYQIAVHARGEYIFFQLLLQDGGILSTFRSIVDSMKSDPTKTDEASLEAQNMLLIQYQSLLDLILFPPTPSLTASDVSWIEEPSFDYNDVVPIGGQAFSDILAHPNYADGKEPFFEGDASCPFVEMSFPLYSNLPEYYLVQESDGDFQIFYMPEQCDTKSLKAEGIEIYQTKRVDGLGLNAVSSYTTLPGPWNILRTNDRGLSFGELVWDKDSNQLCFLASGQGYTQYKAGSQLSLHKPYPVKEIYNTRLGNFLAENQEGSFSAEESIYKDGTNDLEETSSLYAYVSPAGNLITDFVYEEACDFSNGLAACKKNGKWGYIDENGVPVTDFIYDACWSGLYDSPYNWAFPATDDTMVVSKEGKMGVLYRDGSVMIEFGAFEDFAPSWNQQLWAKQGGLWGLIDLSNAKEQLGLPSMEETDTSKNPFSYTIVRDDQSVKDSFGEICVPEYTETVVLEGGNQAVTNAVNHQLLSESVNGFPMELYISPEEIEFALQNPSFTFKKTTDAEVMELTSNYVSVRYYDYAILGGMTALVQSFRGATFDLQTGKRLTLSTLFHRSGEELNSFLRKECVSYIRQNPNSLWSYNAEDVIREISFQDSEMSSFYLKDNTVYLLFPKYMLGAGAMGAVEIPVSVS